MIGIIGAGNMGMAIASRINKKVIMSDTIKARLHAAGGKHILLARSNIDLVKRSNIIILAVKPQDIAGVLKEIKSCVTGHLIISIAAGIETAFIERLLGRVRVVRAMPNMPVLVGKGISAISAGKFVRKRDLAIVRKFFLKLGDVVEVKELFMDAVTAVSGSGPAYYFLVTHLLEKAGVKAGLNKQLAGKLALATFIGAAESARLSGVSMQDLVKKIASKGGTTEAALKVFKGMELHRIVERAVKAARQRSATLRTLTEV